MATARRRLVAEARDDTGTRRGRLSRDTDRLTVSIECPRPSDAILEASMKATRRLVFLLVIAAALLIPAAALLSGADWPDWRGPARTGVSTETGLPSAWSPSGREPGVEGAVRRPLRAGRLRRSPVPAEHVRRRAPTMQERLMCFNADTGKLLVGTQLQHLHERRAAAPDCVGLAGRRSRHRQRLCLQRQRPADGALVATARCSGSARSPKSSACGRRMAGACRRRSSTAIS